MMNPLTKIKDFLGVREAEEDWTPPLPETKVPLNKRVADRRRRNKAARKARKKNRS